MTTSKLAPLRIAPSRHGGHWNVDDWQGIDFTSEEGWEKAINIFEDRIQNRFLKPINAIKGFEGAGFSMMALDCLLIETLVQFMEGTIETPRGQSGTYFHYFLTRTSLSEHFNENLAEIFYKNVRCGILHQAETKGNVTINRKRSQSKIIEKHSESILIQRNLFHDKILDEFNTFLKKLREANIDSPIGFKFKRKMDAICGIHQPDRRCGILAFGSLIDNPGDEISPLIDERYNCFETPFRVEYARKSKTRNNAPTLACLKIDDDKYKWAKKVIAQVLALHPYINENATKNMIYRREFHRIGEINQIYKENNSSGIKIKKSKAYVDDMPVFYVYAEPNFNEILDENKTHEEKADILARQAISSLNEDTFHNERDGIIYLINAIKNNIITTLTPYYKNALLRILDTDNLEEARKKAAIQNGVNIPE